MVSGWILMALETLKGVTEIGGFKVRRKPIDTFSHIVTPEHICIEQHMICFKLQHEQTIESVLAGTQIGVNGCQVDTLIYAARDILEELNKKHPCSYNNDALARLDSALCSLASRTKDREARGVEGTSNA